MEQENNMYGDTKKAKDRTTKERKVSGIFGKRASSFSEAAMKALKNKQK